MKFNIFNAVSVPAQRVSFLCDSTKKKKIYDHLKLRNPNTDMLKCSSQKRKIINSKFAADLFVKRPRVEKWIAASFKNSRFECKIDSLFFVKLNRFSKSAYHLKMVLNSGFPSVLQVSRSLDTESSVSLDSRFLK